MPNQQEMKKLEKDFAQQMATLEDRRKADERKFKGRGKAGAYLTHDILSDRKGLTQRKKLVMDFGFSGQKIEYDLKTLHKMAEATEKAQKTYNSREAGIPITQAIAKSDIEDKRLAKRVASATLYKLTDNILDFRVTASGDTPNAPSYYKVRVRLEDWKSEIAKAKGKDYMTAAQRATMGYVSFDCNCGRYIYWYQYLATIGNFDIAPGETVFPKIRNKRLKGICCKHILKALMTVQSSIIQSRVAKSMQAMAVDKDFEKTGVEEYMTARELKEMEQAGSLPGTTLAKYKRFVAAVKAFNEKQAQPQSKAALNKMNKENEAKMKKELAEKKALEVEFKKVVAEKRELGSKVDQMKRDGYVNSLKLLKQLNMLNDSGLKAMVDNTGMTSKELKDIAKEEGLL